MFARGSFNGVLSNSEDVASIVCDTWSLTLSEVYSLRVSENRVLKRIFGPKRDEVTRD
jgi:hypothetical protein